MLGALIVWWPASFWLQWTMADGTVHTGSPAKFSTKPTEEWKKIRKMYAIKQIKICAEYRDMLPRPRLDLSGTPGLRPIGLSPGFWQTSLGLGSMSRYSAQILICITMIATYSYWNLKFHIFQAYEYFYSCVIVWKYHYTVKHTCIFRSPVLKKSIISNIFFILMMSWNKSFLHGMQSKFCSLRPH